MRIIHLLGLLISGFRLVSSLLLQRTTLLRHKSLAAGSQSFIMKKNIIHVSGKTERESSARYDATQLLRGLHLGRCGMYQGRLPTNMHLGSLAARSRYVLERVLPVRRNRP